MLKVRLIEHTPNPENVVANAARLCYSSLDIEGLFNKYTDEENKKMIDKLVAMGHESPLEHVSFTFGIEGVSRSLTHQLVRHRLASYSQKSQRYVKEGEFEYIIPPAIKNIPEAREVYIDAMNQNQLAYDQLVYLLLEEYCKEEIIKEGWIALEKDTWSEGLCRCDKKKYNEFEKKAIEDARYVLPNACETKIIVTMNARTLLNLFHKRTCNRSQWEIRQMADGMLKQIREVAPNLFKFAGAGCVYGKCPEGSMSCKNPRLDLKI